jgi:hypothetical protein
MVDEDRLHDMIQQEDAFWEREANLNPIIRCWRSILDRLLNGNGHDSISVCYGGGPLPVPQLDQFALLKLPKEVRRRFC